jgi:PAS domain S-box-containing protein
MDPVNASAATEQPASPENHGSGIGAQSAGAPGFVRTDVALPAAILVVEDEQIVALELQDRLTRMGHSVVGVVASAEEAIEDSRRLRPELILMDVKLQGELDGIDAAAAIGTELDAAIVYLTAFADETTLQRAKVTRPYGYILKPFHERELHVVIEVSLYRHRVERALREAELWRSALLRSVGDAVVAGDAAGCVKFMNPLAEALTGWRASEAIGVRFDDVFKTTGRTEHPSDTWEDAPATILIRKDGSPRPIERELTPIRDPVGDGAPMGTVCVFRDVSERGRIRDRQRLLAVASSELVSSLDREVVLTRLTSLIARSWTDWCLIHLADVHGDLRLEAVAHRDPRTHTAVARLAGSAVRNQPATAVGDVVRTGDAVQLDALADRGWPASALGIEGPVAADLAAAAAIIVPLRARNQQLGTLTVASVCHERGFDQADLELAEELARRIAYGLDNAQLYADAQRATVMRDDVLAVVSHDLRNPLSTISMAAEQLLWLPEKIEPQRVMKNAGAIKRNAERMERLIDDLLDVGRVDTGRLSIELQRVSASSIVAEALSSCEAIAVERAIRLVSPPFPDADVQCDRGRVLQVLSNLIDNAVKFSARGGEIRIGGELCRGGFRFSVSDQGKGLAADQLEQVFKRYWQAPETKHRGSGLGLYIAKGIVDAHGGKIWVDSTQGHGSTFHFTIPLAPRSADHPAAPA